MVIRAIHTFHSVQSFTHIPNRHKIIKIAKKLSRTSTYLRIVKSMAGVSVWYCSNYVEPPFPTLFILVHNKKPLL